MGGCFFIIVLGGPLLYVTVDAVVKAYGSKEVVAEWNAFWVKWLTPTMGMRGGRRH